MPVISLSTKKKEKKKQHQKKTVRLFPFHQKKRYKETSMRNVLVERTFIPIFVGDHSASLETYHRS